MTHFETFFLAHHQSAEAEHPKAPRFRRSPPAVVDPERAFNEIR